MSNSIENTLVLCDLDNLLLNAEGNLPQLHRDVLQLFASRGGKLTVYSQRSPKVVRSLLGGVRLSAPALVCGGILAYNFAEGSGTALCSFAGMEDSVLNVLPAAPGIGIAFQMRDGTTRVVRMSEALEAHLRQEWTSFVLSNAADVKGEEVLRILFYQDKKQVPLTALLEKTLGEATVTLRAERMAPDVVALLPGGVSGTAMLNAVCPPAGYSAEQLTVLADCTQMTELVQLAGNSVVPADAPAELRLAAKQTTLTDHDACGRKVRVTQRFCKLLVYFVQGAFFLEESRVQWEKPVLRKPESGTSGYFCSAPCWRRPCAWRWPSGMRRPRQSRTPRPRRRCSNRSGWI